MKVAEIPYHEYHELIEKRAVLKFLNAKEPVDGYEIELAAIESRLKDYDVAVSRAIIITVPMIYPPNCSIWRHFKGGEYEILGMEKHTTNGATMVSYQSRTFGTRFTRPLAEWFDTIPMEESGLPYKVVRFANRQSSNIVD